MIGTYTAAALICAASLLAGRAIFVVCGRREWCWLEPAVGFAALVAVAGAGAKLPGGGTTATLLVVALGVASLGALRRPYALRGALAEGLPVVVVLALVLAIPFAVSGRWGLIGVGFNNDLGLHLAWSEWLRSGFGPEPDAGYPLGPHGLAIAAASFPKISLGQAFVGEIVAITTLTGVTALGALRGLGAGRRTLAAVLVAVPYLAASYFAQAAFKETAEALFVFATAIALPQIAPLPAERRERLRALAPLGILAAGIFFSYSFAGLAWPLAIVALWCLTLPTARRALAPRLLWRRLARRATLAWIAGLAVATLVLAFVGPFGFAGGFGKVAGSNTYGPVSPLEALGVWPAANYRLDAAGGASLAGVAAGIGGLALLAGVVWWVRRRELAAPVALAACALLYLASLPFSGDYSRAKALMIAAPLVMLISSRALLGGPGTGWRAPRHGPGTSSASPAGVPAASKLVRVAYAALAATFVGGAGYSSFLVLRETPVAPPGHGAELRAFVPELRGKSVLYAGQDRFAAYELLGADSHVPVVEFPDENVEASPLKPFDTGDAYSPIDFDSFSYFTLNHHRYVVTGAAAWNSQAPSSFREVARTDSYVLWEQRAKSPEDRQTLLEGTEAAAPVRCGSPEMQVFVAHPGRASLLADPVIARKGGWDGGTVLEPGEQTRQGLRLPAGRWLLSIQYFSPIGLTLSAPGFERDLKPAQDGQRPNTISLANDGQYWPAGVYTQEVAGPVPFTLRTAEPSTIQELTGYDGRSYIGKLVAVPAGPREIVPLGQACGRWLDWYEGAGAP